jgi:hypothetical protein
MLSYKEYLQEFTYTTQTGSAAGNAIASNELGTVIGRISGGPQKLADMMNRPQAMRDFLNDYSNLSNNFRMPVHPGQVYQLFNKHANRMGVHQVQAGNMLTQQVQQRLAQPTQPTQPTQAQPTRPAQPVTPVRR